MKERKKKLCKFGVGVGGAGIGISPSGVHRQGVSLKAVFPRIFWGICLVSSSIHI